MRPSLQQGKLLPESEEDFKELTERLLAGTYVHLHTSCTMCHHFFSTTNTFSAKGWAETQISQLCEECFNGLFADVDPKGDPT